MAEKILMKGNEAIGEAAICAGCRYYFGYPITPQSELIAYMAKKLLKMKDASFVQAESELAAINMVYGAASTGVRVMTSSSSPGISLMQEGISYIACSEVPCVVVNMMRGGPGLGDIQPAQGDYFQATKGGGHGDYHLIVLAPSSVQELVDLTMDAFDLADKYRNPAMILGDGLLGQMMEAVEFKERPKVDLPSKESWTLVGCKGRKPHWIVPFNLNPSVLEKMNLVINEKYKKLKEHEVRYESINIENADLIIVAYGTVARIVKTVIQKAKKEGINIGLIRPITLFPFPEKIISKTAERIKKFLVVEMSLGQMIEDVKLAVNGKAEVNFYGRCGGIIPTPIEILKELNKYL
ncbi:MAG: 3-methyl-2-oxobutanoate dehydrogenase subunit VorB [Candidatus Infernicultor aquiphilus]|uniref:3-methyl-2-oxobutanoate dehydrogenase subunit VorB n=1 Tax=Candidatus Infernicultor aquiphilus TaxID=1805029 RepID=A0A1J5GIU7_9BACT|nr:3-methyl-2-oxobutanoate dehydrogenase subunit VorB [bacterium]OIP66960.1 MAG: 3-methyl-2-oxobutanoate dehydrogenase subunit VorB [Candidatus Atribacteria bacterium CG2_30_33_13]PIU25439.1 MAG: 3-methyl-2-oxobutanoate dehydrogenase subunit VorB [Candidatus Atribacteria bacterium CG08_land_8_20_14_0_20_33_29]PIW11430.1 MAG: 3-methyl-2-oxobutanoate dehydrogenase subunit VorB [Candidatus Atribacteria bacterium CG17_big_fil_post_rev_8_21_14_2_50_34_11]PIX35248.1 MAG: 3-methyl-2-oxobutanoate dehyd